MKRKHLSSKIKGDILAVCKDIAGSMEIVAACLYGPHLYGYANDKNEMNVLLVVRSPQPVLKNYKRRVGDISASFLVIDAETFKKDVENGLLGELVVENIFTPYSPLINKIYLWRQEVKAKKRIISDLIDNLVSEFPELSYDLYVKPEYFIYETMARMASLFPPITYSFLNILRGDLKERNVKFIMKGIKAALAELAQEGKINLHRGEYVRIRKDYIETVKAKRTNLVDLFRGVGEEVFRQIFRVFPKLMFSFVKDQETYTKLPANIRNIFEDPIFKLEDSKKHLFMPTPLGLVSLSDKTTIEGFVKKAVPKGKALGIEIEKIGGVLNSVYLLKFKGEKKEQRIVVKLFKDWYGLKWFPLALWAIGTRDFSVVGKSRLEKEYAINRFLSSQEIRVPKILYVSPKERLIFEEFVKGLNLVEVLRNLASKRIEAEEAGRIVKAVGKTVAEVHKIGVALGDCKPENLVITPDGRVCFLDLEQASRGGNKVWDIAEFLFYAGHYFPSISSLEAAKIVTTKFIHGYLEAGGSAENIRKSSSARYLKVFSFFTPPHVLITIRNTCKEIFKTNVEAQQEKLKELAPILDQMSRPAPTEKAEQSEESEENE
ncbi:MAG: lipopolysaccharide kinase InaA family protein [Candidatus Bathyarchaeia archaeon]